MTRSLRCPCGRTEHRDGNNPADDECGDCDTFWCARCERWVSWSFGCGDDAPSLCDGCYAAIILPGVLGTSPPSEVTC